jgi:Chain length determinant protein/G-rich domain on putative tyrosine kinase
MKDQDKISKEKAMVKDDEIDLIDMTKTLWQNRTTIVKTTVLFTFFGLLVAFLSEKEYLASTIMVPQINNPSSKLGGLSSLASLAGFNMDMNTGSDAISPMLYPMIISSVNFQLEVMNNEYFFEEIEKPISLFDYYSNVYKPGFWGILKKYTIRLPRSIISDLKKDKNESFGDSESGPIKLTRAQENVRKIIEESLTLEVNEKDGYLTLLASFHQANLSAQVAQKSQLLLQEYVTNFKVEKASAQLNFIKERYEENKGEFEEAQSNLATFRDANKNISSEILRNHEERLQNEYQLAFEVYSELAKQLEQSMIKVEENTPVFSIIEDVFVPAERAKPKRSVILFFSIILGGVTGVIWIVGKMLTTSFKRQWEARDY